MGINTLTTPTAIQQSFLYTSTGVTKNDLIINNESGFATKVPQAINISQANNTTAGTSLFSSNNAFTNYTYYGNTYGSGWGKTSCQLSNGNIVLVYPGDGSTTPNLNVNIQIQGYGVNAQVGSVISIYESSAVNFVKVAKINDSNFAVCWGTQSQTIYYAVYSNNGTEILGKTSVATGTSVGAYYDNNGICYNIEALSNGNFIIIYTNSSTGDVYFNRYDSTGTLQGSAVLVHSSGYGKYFNILPLSSGGFALGYLNTNFNQYRFAIYSSTGTVVKSQFLVTSTNSSYYLQYGAYDSTIVELSNGNIAFISSNTTQYNLVASVYDSSGNLVNQNTFETYAGTTYTLSQIRPGLCSTSSGFAIKTIGNTYDYLYTFDTSGNSLTSRVQLSSIPSGVSGSQGYLGTGSVLINNGAAGFAHSSTRYDGSYYSSYVQSFSPNGTILGTGIANLTNGSGYGNVNYQNAFQTLDGNIYKNYRFDYGWNCVSYFVFRKSIYGVALETVSANSIFKLGTAGAYNLSTSYGGGTFDNRTATISGTKGSVIGSVASLQGLA